MYIIEFLKNFPAGVLMGSVFTLALCAAFDADVTDDMTRFYTFVFSALIGLLAASVAFGGVLLNLDKQRELIERRHVAARSVLPLTLSKLHKLTESGFETVMRIEQLKKEPTEAQQHFQELNLPEEDIRLIRDCIEASDIQTQAWLSLILAHWQVEVSRLETDLFDQHMFKSTTQIAASAIDWLTIRAMIILLYDYSRTGRTPELELRPELIKVPIRSTFLNNNELAKARTNKLTYIESNGGWSFEGFKSRFTH